MKESTQRIIARVILCFTFVSCGLALIPEKGVSKANDNLDELPNLEDTYIENDYIEEIPKEQIEQKLNYTMEEFEELITLGEAIKFHVGATTYYYLDIHALSNQKFMEMPGYTLWQEYVPNNDYSKLIATDNFMYKPIEEKMLKIK